MAESFDPYHTWLGIPPEEQPPHCYRLLGIGLFESSPDVIAHAADRQMIHVRSFQTGRHSQLSQQLLNELSAARVCLLDPHAKSVYDAQLREYLAALEPAAAEPAFPVTSELTDTPVLRDRSRPPRRSRRTKKKKVAWGGIVMLLATLILAAAVVAILELTGHHLSFNLDGDQNQTETEQPVVYPHASTARSRTPEPSKKPPEATGSIKKQSAP